jgi:hypothetical protein
LTERHSTPSTGFHSGQPIKFQKGSGRLVIIFGGMIDGNIDEPAKKIMRTQHLPFDSIDNQTFRSRLLSPRAFVSTIN